VACLHSLSHDFSSRKVHDDMLSNVALTDIPVASVVIPAHNRKAILGKVLASLSSQDLPREQFEIIVIDDGSTDGTGEMIETMINSDGYFVYHYQERKGPAGARNQGIKMARGRLIIFIDSDLVVCPEFVRMHINAHTEDNVIVHGPVIHTTDFDNPTSENYKITDIARAFFATGNVSIRRDALIAAGLFDEDFKEYGWEDLEMGVRLRKLNMVAVKCPEAKGYHYKPKLDLKHLDSLKQRERERGHTAIIFYRKHPTFKVRMMILLTPVFFALDRILTLGNWPQWKSTERLLNYLEQKGHHMLLRFFVRIITNHAYANGMRETLREEKQSRNWHCSRDE
jgi:glycosyltransferase involved in cell wall biosynthesis